MNRGRCACGAVQFETDGKLRDVTYCHCSKCRRWHGHAGAWTATERTHFRLVESRGLKWHAVNDKARRGFCGECGSSLFWDEEETRISICAGAFDAPTGMKSKAHIFVGSKGDYYDLADDGLLRFEELPPRRAT